MKVSFRNNSVRRFQEGGAMAPEAGAPEEAPMAPEEQAAPEQAAPQVQDPMELLMQLAQGAAQALQNQDCQIAMQVCDGLVQFIQMAQGGAQGGQPAPEEGEPVYRRGGQLVRRVRK